MMRLVRRAAASLAAAWLAGFLWFAYAALQTPAAIPDADGIVVLTGGADRIAAGLRLLQSGKGGVLLISGVGGGADLRSLLRGSDADPAALGDEALADRITLGRTATTTIGNAGEIAAWAHANALGSLIVVTAGYHMPRALAEIGRAAPALVLYPAPVVPPALRDAHPLGAMRLLASEYTKWLISALGLTRLEAG